MICSVKEGCQEFVLLQYPGFEDQYDEQQYFSYNDKESCI